MYFYAPSYQTLVFALNEYPLDEIYMLTNHDKINAFCLKAGIKSVHFPRNQDESLTGIFKYKAYIDKLLANYRNEEICFCIFCYDVFGLYMMHRLSKHNRIRFVNKDDVIGTPVSVLALLNRKHRFTLYKWLKHSIVLRMGFDVFKLDSGNFFLGIRPKHLEREFPKPTVEESTRYFKPNTALVLNSYGLSSYDVIYIDDGLYNKYYQREEIVQLLQSLCAKGYSVAVKPCPGLDVVLNNEQITIIPDELPAELAVSNSKLAVIGVISATLKHTQITISKISLIDLVRWLSNDNRVWGENFMHQFDNIQYPRSIADCINLIKNRQAVD